MSKDKVDRKTREQLITNLMMFLDIHFEDKRFFEHQHFQKFSIIEYKHPYHGSQLFAVPSKLEMFTHGIMGVSTNHIQAYEKAMLDCAKNCNAEFDLKESKWTERTLEYILQNPPPEWYYQQFKESLKRRWDKFEEERLARV